MKEKLKKGFKKTIITTNSEGHILNKEDKTHTYVAGNPEEFYLVYASLIVGLKRDANPPIAIFAFLLERYNGGHEFGLNKYIKETIKKELNIKAESTLYLALNELVEGNYLIKIPNAQSTYMINPSYAWKGNSIERKKSVKIYLTYKDEINKNGDNDK